MQILNKNIKSQRWLSVLIVCCIIINSCLYLPSEKVRAEEPWVLIEGGTNGIQNTEVLEKTIVQTGRHNSADDYVIRYRTKYYYMARQTYDLKQKFTSGSNAEIQYSYVPFTFGKTEDNGTTKTVEYVIQQKDFMSAAAKLGITGDYIVEHGSAAVYLNNVFATFLGNTTLDNFVWGYQEMLAEAGWSSQTVNNLKGYYNFKYVIQNNTVFKVKVVAVDEKYNILDDDLLGHTKNAIYDEVIPPYTLKNDIIKKGEVIYQYSKWEYKYEEK